MLFLFIYRGTLKTFPICKSKRGKILIYNKDIRGNDASLTNGEWKTLTNFVKTWNSVVVPINHQYYEYTQVHELISDRKTAFWKQNRRGNSRSAFGRLSNQ